jgi:hypothetical protein
VHRQHDPQRDERREKNVLDGARGRVIVQELLKGSLVIIIGFPARGWSGCCPCLVKPDAGTGSAVQR